MTEYELDKIKKSFVRSNAKCPVEVACLLTVIKYYNGKETDIHTLTEWCKYNPQNEMFRLLGTKRSFSQNETFFFSHP